MSSHRMNGASALIVNDDPIQLQLLSGILKEETLHTITCQSADEALRVLESNNLVDLIITDLHMPGIDGWRFCRLLRSSEYPLFNHIPILVVSATFSGKDADSITAELGANAFLSLPIRKARFLEQVYQLLAGDSTPQTTAVLIVDDSPSVTDALKKAFEANSYRAFSAKNGDEAIRLFKQMKPEIVVIDFHLPDMLGDLLLTTLKRLCPHSAFIIITIDPRPELAVEMMKKGAAAYIRKPFDPRYLIRMCENARRERSLLQVEEILEARTRDLYESEVKYRIIYQNSPEMMHSVNTSGNFCDVNRKWLSELGYAREEIVGKPFETILADASRTALKGRYQAEKPGNLRLKDEPCQMVRKTGEILDVLLNSEHVSEGNGQEFTLCVVRNVTEQKKLDEERIKMAAQANKFEGLNVMAGSIAHNFNNLLMGIMGNLEMALFSLPPDSPVIRNIHAAQLSAQRAVGLSAMMLTFAGKGQVHMKPVNLNRLVGDMIGVLEVSASKHADILFIPSDLPVFCSGDSAQLRQVLMNLVTNAAESMSGPDRGVITIQTGIKFFQQHSFRHPFAKDNLSEGYYAHITVADTGSGIDPDALQKVFDPFFTTKFTGRGLGLAEALGIVRAHRGAISIDSEPQKGTNVQIALPAITDIPVKKEVSALKIKEPMSQFSGTILLVDDEEIVLEVGKRMIEQIGFSVLTAVNGFEAVEIYRKHRETVTCVLLDLTMPKMSGEETLAELRRISPDVKVILSSGFTADIVAQKFSNVLPVDFIHKPYNTGALRDKLMKVLSNGS